MEQKADAGRIDMTEPELAGNLEKVDAKSSQRNAAGTAAQPVAEDIAAQKAEGQDMGK